MSSRRTWSRSLSSFALAGLVTAVAVASEAPELVADRPDVTESAVTVPTGRWQLEAGATWEREEGERSLTWGEPLLRVGVHDRVELRFGMPSFVDDGSDPDGFGDASVGIKLALANRPPDRPRRPQAALIVESSLPTGSTARREPHAQPVALLALGWALGERTDLDANLGTAYASSDGEQFAQGLASAALGVGLSARLGGFVELYGLTRDVPGGGSRGFFDTGLTWLWTPDLQLDGRIGIELGASSPQRVLGLGIVLRR